MEGKLTNNIMNGKKPSISDNVIFIGFADNKVPEFKEVNSKDWILYGEKNDFPDHLLYLYNKSSNHNAIINGKVTYILGKGFPVGGQVNNKGETSKKLLNKVCTDIELFGGFYLQFVWTRGGKPNITHIPFHYIRADKSGKGYWYSKNWKRSYSKEYEPKYIPAFDASNKQGAQLFSYSEYRPGCGVYALPGYLGALNDIETDVEISKYNLSVIKQGMFSSKMIVFNTGEPTEEAKRKLERGFKEKFAGSDNAGRFMLVFNQDPAKAPIINDLSTTDLDKLFDQLNKTTQAEIFSGHQVTSPMLFGIMEPGKLGARNEMQLSYEIFKNTYVTGKQQALEEICDFIFPFIGLPAGQKIDPLEAVSDPLDPKDFKELLPDSWVYEKLGIDTEEYPDIPQQPQPPVVPGAPINQHIKSMSGRENQNLMRIVRQYKNGKLPKQAAEMLLSKGYNLTPDDISSFLSFAIVEREEEVAEMFSLVGQPRDKFIIYKTKQSFQEQHFKDIKGKDSDIINLIGKDKRITPQVIAKTIHETPEYVSARIKILEDEGVLTRSTQTIGTDTIIEHAVNPEMIDTREPADTVDIYIRYSYEAKPGLEPIIETTRPFCKKLIELDKLYSRSEIETISQRVGFSVWDRKGGFWGSKDECRHRWVSHVVIKKK